MSWGRIDDRWYSHPKVVACGFAARGLWVTMFAWCCHHGNNGCFPRHVLRHETASKIPEAEAFDLARQLVSVGLWEETPLGWSFHDWNDWAGRHAPSTPEADASPSDQRTEAAPDVTSDDGLTPRQRSAKRAASARWGKGSASAPHQAPHTSASPPHAAAHVSASDAQPAPHGSAHHAEEGGGGEISDPIQSDPNKTNTECAGAGGGERIDAQNETHAPASAPHQAPHTSASHVSASGPHANTPPSGSSAPDPEAGVTRAARAVTLCRKVDETQYEKGLGVPFGPIYRVLAELLRLPELREGQYREEATKTAKQLVTLATGQSLGSYEIQPHVEEAMDRLGRLLVEEPMRPSRAIGWVNTTAKGLFREDPTGAKWGKAQPSKAPTEAA